MSLMPSSCQKFKIIKDRSEVPATVILLDMIIFTWSFLRIKTCDRVLLKCLETNFSNLKSFLTHRAYNLINDKIISDVNSAYTSEVM